MTDNELSFKDRVKKHFSNNKQIYRDLAMYSIGVAASVTTFALIGKAGDKAINAQWDAQQAQAVSELGEEALATLTKEGRFMYILPFESKEALLASN